ncbi:MAG TPA: MBL fold metallo-hydrolase [Gaiellaceae bacterium]|nr:MBL fold metallo-hydrolase [Gaiellaceae bacterium]
MTEPRAVAASVEEVAPGVWHWLVPDDRIGAWSAGHAVASEAGTVLVDPVPLSPEALARLGEVTAVCLTAGTHQRSAWRYRRELGARVYAPALSRLIDEEPDERYGEGDVLPGGLTAVFTPGAGTTQHTFVLERDGGIAFVADLVTNYPGRGLAFVPERHLHDPEEMRRSVRKLLGLPFALLCLAHGAPVRDDPKAAIAALLAHHETPGPTA